MGSARSAFVISALLCVSGPAFSSELESPTDESRPSGFLGHTIIRTYGAFVRSAQDNTLDQNGWGTGLAVSYGVARAARFSLELAYYRFESAQGAGIPEAVEKSDWKEVRQVSLSLGLQPPSRAWLRPWLDVGLGVYEMTETREGYYYNHPYREVSSGTHLGANWGVGLSARLGQRLAAELGGRYHHSFGRAFLTGDQYMDGARLLSAQAGLSYVVR